MKLNLKRKIIAGFVALVILIGAFLLGASRFDNIVYAGASSDLESLDEIRYGRDDLSPVMTYATETIGYTRREVEYYETAGGVPMYSALAYLPNSCGVTAGAIIVGFYDKYYEELIPDYTAYYSASGRYKKSDSVYVPQMTETLYTLMRTNVDGLGVNKSDCLRGLTTYFTQKGRTLVYFTVTSSNQIDASDYLNSVNQNRPVIIFGGDTNIQVITSNSTYDEINNITIPDNHVFVGYGYYVFRYYNGDSNFRTDTYLRVACGREELLNGFIRISSTSGDVQSGWLHSAYAVIVT